MLEWNVHEGHRGDGDGDGLKKYGKYIQQVKRMAAVVRELQRAFQYLRAASDIEMALFYSVLPIPTLFGDKVIVSFTNKLDL